MCRIVVFGKLSQWSSVLHAVHLQERVTIRNDWEMRRVGRAVPTSYRAKCGGTAKRLGTKQVEQGSRVLVLLFHLIGVVVGVVDAGE